MSGSLEVTIRFIYIYIYIIFILLLGLTGLSLHVRCIPHQQFDKTFLSKCVNAMGHGRCYFKPWGVRSCIARISNDINHQRKLGSNTSVLWTNRILRLEMMKGGARLRLDLDEGWCETLHDITIHHTGLDLDEGWCETLRYITIHQKRIDLDEGWCETLHDINNTSEKN